MSVPLLFIKIYFLGTITNSYFQLTEYAPACSIKTSLNPK